MITFHISQAHRQRNTPSPKAFWAFASLAKNVPEIRQPALAMFPSLSCRSPASADFRNSSSIQSQKKIYRHPTSLLTTHRNPSLPRVASLVFWLKTEYFWTLKKTCSVSPDGISGAEGNRLAFVSLSLVDYQAVPKAGWGVGVAGGKVWSVDLA